ncbi:MAG: FAD-binding protein [Arenimonas sp.]|nr:FAD-binding protein [Arenimonas sp.]MBP7981720.1 FAD-binding protein [Arenimonas sp.]
MERAVFNAFEQALGKQAVLTGAADCLAYGFDNSAYRQNPCMVLLPTNTEQVQAAVRLARHYRLPLTARGRGTNTTGASVPVENGIVISFERMNRILALSSGDRTAVVQPGVLNGDLQTALLEHGLFWPPDPTSAPFCSIGGNIACNAGGPRAVKYGATRDNVLALTAVTGTGELVAFGARTNKNSSGFDLSRLLIGSEGGLALVVEATLKLTPKPAATRMLRALYRDVESAALAVARLMNQPDTPSMLEFMDATALKLARDIGGADIPEAGALLMIEADGDPAQLPALLQKLAGYAQGEGCLGTAIARDADEQAQLLAARKALSPALRSLASGKINEDVVVPITQVPALVRFVEQLSRESGLPIVSFGHIGNGNVHVNILFEKSDAEQTRIAEACAGQLFTEVLRLGGMLSGEHGIGLAKKAFMAQAFSSATLEMMRGIKQLFDPDGILNPGKTLPD